MAKVLVTGSKGVIGQWLVKILNHRGHDVFGVDMYHSFGEEGFEQLMGSETPSYARTDVGNYREIERIFEYYGRFDFVYHLAAEFGRWNGEDYYERVWQSNAIGTKNMIRLQEEYGFKMIFASSSEIYGDWDGMMAEHVPDKWPLRQLNDYALSKWVNENQIRNSSIKTGTETVIVRFFNTYGMGEYYHPYRSVNCKFCYHAIKGLPITVYEGYYRTSTYLSDAVNALANVIKNFIPGEVYNIAGSTYHSIEYLAQVIWQESNADPHLISYKNKEILTTKTKKVDNSKAIEDLDYKETVMLREGVIETINWMKEIYNE